MEKEEKKFNVEEHTTLDNKIIDVFPASHRYIHQLEAQLKKQEEIIDKIYKKCKPEKVSYDFNVWLKLNDDWKILDDFAKRIRYNLHPIITDAYSCDIKNSINRIIEITKNEVVLKEDILEILEGKGKNKDE